MRSCRGCGNSGCVPVIDLGVQPLANAYLEPGTEGDERSYPLRAWFCPACTLMQVEDSVPASELFDEYAYFSSYSESWVAHAARFVERSVERFGLDGSSLVVEVASNDGYLLRHLVEREIPVLGIEPAGNVADVARAAGIPTVTRFFGSQAAADLAEEHGRADLIVANNVLAHTPDPNDLVAGMARLLAPGGAVSIEVPHLLHLVEQVQFDTIYHEHFSYFSLHAAMGLLERNGLAVVDVEALSTHGGSLRITAVAAGTDRAPSPAVARVLADERAAGLERPEGYADLERQAIARRDALLAHLNDAREHSRRVVAYGAAAKGNTLLNFAGVGPDLVDYVVDRNPVKQGKLLPGSHLAIRSPTDLVADRPDEVLILPWNLREEIAEQMSVVRSWGGRFVVAIPALETFT